MVTIRHASVYANDPKLAAEHLAALCGGRAEVFPPLPGGWACLFDGTWEGAYIELYPRTARLVWNNKGPAFGTLAQPATGAGTHFNLKVDRTRVELEAVCEERGLLRSWRDWSGHLDVQIEDGLVVECVCRG